MKMTARRVAWRWGIAAMVALAALPGAALAQVEAPRGGIEGPSEE